MSEKKVIKFEKNFASNERSKYWSEKNTLKPRDVFRSCNSKFIFDCNICGHEFFTSLDKITNGNQWCPFCANRKLCDQDCDYCLNKSFASNPKSIYWSPKNTILSRFVFKSHTKKIIFD